MGVPKLFPQMATSGAEEFKLSAKNYNTGQLQKYKCP